MVQDFIKVHLTSIWFTALCLVVLTRKHLGVGGISGIWRFRGGVLLLYLKVICLTGKAPRTGEGHTGKREGG